MYAIKAQHTRPSARPWRLKLMTASEKKNLLYSLTQSLWLLFFNQKIWKCKESCFYTLLSVRQVKSVLCICICGLLCRNHSSVDIGKLSFLLHSFSSVYFVFPVKKCFLTPVPYNNVTFKTLLQKCKFRIKRVNCLSVLGKKHRMFLHAMGSTIECTSPEHFVFSEFRIFRTA